MLKKALDKYVSQINEIYADNSASPELSYRYPFQQLLEFGFKNTSKSEVKVIHEGKTIKDTGKPDFFIKNSKLGHTISYIETKSINSNEIEKEHYQIGRYVSNLETVCTTDYCNFQLFKNGKLSKSFQLLRLKKNKFELVDSEVSEFEDLLRAVSLDSLKQEINSEALAVFLAKRAKLIKETLEENVDSRKPESKKILDAFDYYQKSLNPDSTLAAFLSNYSQCLTYGLFVAKIENPKSSVNKSNIEQALPKNQNILKTLFSFLGEKSLVGQKISWILDDICNYLNIVEMQNIIDEFDYSEWAQDPVIHFYETFIKHFDSEERADRGIYYTADPVVDYIVNSVDLLIKDEKTFNKGLGLASKGVTLLDPAAGTSTFLIKSLMKAYNNMRVSSSKGEAGKKMGEYVVPNFYGMEILLAPYVISHLKLSRVLESLTVENKQDKFLNLMLTNTLSMKEGVDGDLPFMKELYKENKKATKLKKETPIMVVIGNPPYSPSKSSHGNKFIDNLIKPYKDLNGKKERNSKALTNDYVKFLRWAEWKISQNDGVGIVGMITSNSYLNGVTFRGMRHHLLKSFDKIYILNLYGDNRIEREENGEQDENVFDIKEGVSIIFGIKDKSKKEGQLGELFYKEIIGSRSKKYLHLLNHNVGNDNFDKLEPSAPYFMFKPFEMDSKDSSSFRLDTVFKSKYHGLTTHRDHFVVSHDKEALLNKIHTASSKRRTIDETIQMFDLHDSSDWCAVDAINGLRRSGIDEDLCKNYSYRPFFSSFIYNDANLIDRSRPQMQADVALPDNKFLLIGRSGQAISGGWDLVFSSNTLVDKNFYYRGGAYCFPIYNHREGDLLETSEVNINEEFLNKIRKTTTLNSIGALDVFYYIQGLLNHKEYLEKYKDQLQVDFPPIPIPSKNDFLLYWEYGELIDELFISGVKEKDWTVKFKLTGNNRRVESAKFNKGEFFINKETKLLNLTPEHYKLSHGGYPLVEKYLKDLKKADLELDAEKVKQLNRAINSKLLLEEIKLDIIEDFSVLRSTGNSTKPLKEKLLKKIQTLENNIKKRNAG